MKNLTYVDIFTTPNIETFFNRSHLTVKHLNFTQQNLTQKRPTLQVAVFGVHRGPLVFGEQVLPRLQEVGPQAPENPRLLLIRRHPLARFLTKLMFSMML